MNTKLPEFNDTPLLDRVLQRRDVLKAGLTLSAVVGLGVSSVTPAFALPQPGSYKIALKNLHTGESFQGVYREGGRYLPDAFEKISMVLRDFRANEVHPIDPRAIDILAVVHRMTGSREAYGVISGYRSPRTNSYLRQTGGGGVAKNSLHMVGRAVDVRLDGFNTKGLQQLAMKLRAGGVGYYRKSNFVHMDSGDVRSW